MVFEIFNVDICGQTSLVSGAQRVTTEEPGPGDFWPQSPTVDGTKSIVK